MQTSTLAQGPLGLGGRYITIGGTIYNLEPGDNPATYPAPLKAVLDAEALDQATEAELRSLLDRQRKRLRAQNGVPVVPAHAVMRAAVTRGVRAQIETWISNNPDNPLALRLKYGAENITQAELVGVSPTEGTAVLTRSPGTVMVMEAEFVKYVIYGVFGVVIWFLKRTVDDVESRLKAMQNEVNVVKMTYLHKDDFKEFKGELRSMFEELKQDIHSLRHPNV